MVTRVPIYMGGTNAQTEVNARANLGLAIGINVQAYSTNLNAIALIGTSPGTLFKENNDSWYVLKYFSGNRSPSSANDTTQGYHVGSRWINTAANVEWVCTNNSSGAAIWREAANGSGTSGSLYFDDDGNTPVRSPLASTNDAIAIGNAAIANSYGKTSFSVGRFSADGDAQGARYIVRNSTTNSTQTELFLNGTNARIPVSTNSTVVFSALIVGRRTDVTGESYGFTLEGVVENNSGTTGLVGSSILKILARDDLSCNVAVSANNTSDTLVFQVTGNTSKTIRWVGRVETIEVGG